MAGSSRVSSVWKGSVPSTNEPATGIRVEKRVKKPGGGCQGIEFFIRVPADARLPEAGDPIKWGPRHATIGDTTYDKLTWELDPDRALY